MKRKPITCLREPCGRPREGAGEASVAVPVGRANEHRKNVGPECRVFQIGRRQHWSHRQGEGRPGSAVSENPSTQVRLLPGPGRPPRCRDACIADAEVNEKTKRRMHGGEESDSGIVLRKPANKARGAAWRSRWREGPGATGERSRQKHGPDTEPGDALGGPEPASGPSVTQAPASHGSSRGVPSQPERGAGCPSGPVRICGGAVG